MRNWILFSIKIPIIPIWATVRPFTPYMNSNLLEWDWSMLCEYPRTSSLEWRSSKDQAKIFCCKYLNQLQTSNPNSNTINYNPNKLRFDTRIAQEKNIRPDTFNILEWLVSDRWLGLYVVWYDKTCHIILNAHLTFSTWDFLWLFLVIVAKIAMTLFFSFASEEQASFC